MTQATATATNTHPTTTATTKMVNKNALGLLVQTFTFLTIILPFDGFTIFEYFPSVVVQE